MSMNFSAGSVHMFVHLFSALPLLTRCHKNQSAQNNMLPS